MAFGLDYIKGVEEEKFKRIQKIEKEEQEEEVNASKAQSSAPSRSPSQKPRHSFRRKGQSSASPSYTSIAKDAVDSQKEVDEMFDEVEGDDSQPTIKKEARGNVFKREKLMLQAIRLAQDVAEFKKYSLDELHALEKRARNSPHEIISQLRGIYENEIRPQKRQSLISFKDQISSNPGKIVFLLKKGRLEKTSFIDPNENPEQRLLHGCLLESVYASSTPFPPSNEIVELSIASKEMDNPPITNTSDKKPSVKP